ncbi:MAG: hypothetical protein ABJF88_02255 [Rhodothermales bacterium]
MRILIALFSFGALALSGCADGLTGPESDLVSTPVQAVERAADVPTAVDVPGAEPSLYASWVGSDDQVKYELTFIQDEAAPFRAESAFVGSGMCSSNDATEIMEISQQAPECFVHSGSFEDEALSFSIEDSSGEVIAKAYGKAAPDFSVLTVGFYYADGSESIVTLMPAE